MTGRQWAQTAGACLAVAVIGAAKLALTPAHPAHVYPWPLNMMVLATVALAGYSVATLLWDTAARRQEERAERALAARRALLLVEAADQVITRRPESDYPGQTCTPEAVQLAAACLGLAVTLPEAHAVLTGRLLLRGYSAAHLHALPKE